MVKLTRIYTGGGDGGETSLGDGGRVAKHDIRVEAYGTVDEANAVIGLVRAGAALPGDVDAMLSRIQNDLFDLGADLCTPEGSDRGAAALRVSAEQAARLEAEIDAINAPLAPLNSFVLPGGSPAAAQLHHARTVVRRAERLVAQLADAQTVNRQVLVYLNRLSDLLFVLARHCNDGGKADVLWVPGANR
ncbi:MAG: cob(I)yrinic acid a,c-diamide adenosyltransferase [Alphaproteobacteria bacterium]|nr:cob(I)yrinic acid a,c-diamide adenosyltransferase [Alphaproteobacteria bacterium]